MGQRRYQHGSNRLMTAVMETPGVKVAEGRGCGRWRRAGLGGVASMILLLMMMTEDSDSRGLSSSRLVLRVLALLL